MHNVKLWDVFSVATIIVSFFVFIWNVSWNIGEAFLALLSMIWSYKYIYSRVRG
jgi:hypothetical protein